MSTASLLAQAVRHRSRMAVAAPTQSLWLSTRSAPATAVGPSLWRPSALRSFSSLAQIRTLDGLSDAHQSQPRLIHGWQRLGTNKNRGARHCPMSTIADDDEDASEPEDAVDNDDDDDSRLFSSLDNLNPRTLEQLERQGITKMTEIQAKTWDAVSTGRDVVARSRTGSGKTLAFLLPAVEKVLRDMEAQIAAGEEPAEGTRILVISPTRELASQIDQAASTLQQPHRKLLSNQVVFGGTNKGRDLAMMDRRLPVILTGTPGRLLDHLENSDLRERNMYFRDTMKNVDVLVLDEMDRLLDMGFSQDIRRIMSFLPPKDQRQTLLFSATVPPSVKQEIRFCTQNNALNVDCIQDADPESHTVKTVQQSYVSVPREKQIAGVVETILHLYYSETSSTEDSEGRAPKIIVFFNTTAQVVFFSDVLRELGVRVLEIHSKKDQDKRSKTSDKFRKASPNYPSILLTSDVSARGVDYPDVTHVVQVGSASDRETYIHRLGRTGRAGKTGKGILVLVHPDEEVVLDMELDGMKIPLDEELHGVISNGEPTNQQAASLIGQLPEVLQSEKINSRAGDCYRSLLGFYVQRFRKLRIRGAEDAVVDMINEFSDQAMLEERPSVSTGAAQQCGVMRHPDIKVGGSSSRRDQGQGYGGGNGRGRSFDRFDNGGGFGGRSRSSGRDRYDSGGGYGGRNRSSSWGEDRRGYGGGGRGRY